MLSRDRLQTVAAKRKELLGEGRERSFKMLFRSMNSEWFKKVLEWVEFSVRVEEWERD